MSGRDISQRKNEIDPDFSAHWGLKNLGRRRGCTLTFLSLLIGI